MKPQDESNNYMLNHRMSQIITGEYMFNVYKNQLSRQTGSRNLTGPKTLPTIWYIYIPSTVTEENATKNILDGRKDRRTDRGKTVYPPPPSGSGGINVSNKPYQCRYTVYNYQYTV